MKAAGGFAWRAGEGHEALLAEGDDGAAGAGGLEEIPDGGGEAAGEIVEGFADFTLGGAEQIDILEAEEVGLAAADVGGDHGDGAAEGGEDAIEEAGGDEAVAEVGEDDGGGAAGGVEDPAGEGLFGAGVDGGGGAVIEFEHFGLFDEEAVLGDVGAIARKGDDIDAGGGEAKALGTGGGIGEGSDERGARSKPGEVEGDDGRASVVVLLGEGAEGHHGAFAGDAGGFAVVVAVEDVVADDDDALVAKTGDELVEGEVGEAVALAKAADFFALEGVAGVELADEGGGGEDDVAAGADDAAAVLGDDLALGEEARVAIVLVLFALDVNVGLERVEELDRGWVGVDVDEIAALECGEAGGAEVFGDEGAVDALIDLGVAAEGDDQKVAEGPGELEVVDVAGVDDVETAVAVDDGSAGFASFSAESEEAVKGADFGCGALRRGGRHGLVIGRWRGGT